jgi:abortive infection bacteriophage resistance protein
MPNKHSSIIDAIANLLSNLNGSVAFSAINYWQDMPSEYKQNWLSFYDYEEKYEHINREQENEVFIKFTATIFDPDSLKLGTIFLGELIGAIDTDLNLKKLVKKIRLINSKKLASSNASNSAQIQLFVALIYRTPNFTLGD